MDARRLHGLAASQRWLLTAEQLHEHLTEGQFRHARETGQILKVQPRIYKPWGAPESWEQRVQATCWSYDAVASHRSGARLLCLDSVPAVRIEVTVVWPRLVRADGVIAHSSKILSPEFVTCLDGIPVTTPDRTCLDLSAVCGIETLERAWADADRLGLVTAESLHRTLIKMQARGRRRIAVVRQLLQAWDPRLDLSSLDLHARTLAWIIQAGLPEPEVEFWVVVNGQRFRLDLAWPALKICVECDGWGPHKNRLRFDSDRDKIPELELAGWLVIPTTSRQSREVVVDRIRRAFAQRLFCS